MIIAKHEFHGHQFLELSVITDHELMSVAREQALKKCAHVHLSDPAGRKRSSEEAFSQNFLGVVADAACAHILRLYIAKYQLGATVIRYDDIREDEFRDPDQYDIKIQDADREWYVEVRSSVCCFISLERMLKEWQVLGPYASASKGETERSKHYYFRPLYHFTRSKQTGDYQRADGERHLINGHLKLYLVGGATNDLIRKKGRQEFGQQLKQAGANYWVLNILDAMDVPTLFEDIKSILRDAGAPGSL